MSSPSCQFDVVIVGAGGSGLAAGARCGELGLSAIVLEKQSQPGGTTGIAVGSFTGNQTRLQGLAEIEDSLEAHAEDAGKFAPAEIEVRNNDSLRRFFLSQTATTLEWLEELGLAFHGPSPEPPNRVPRMHNVAPNAKAYVAALQSLLLRTSGKLMCDASVEQLLFAGERVVGVVANVKGKSQTFRASRGVVLAAGDYANSPYWISRYKGDRFSNVEGINPNAAGDGHRLVEAAGGQLLNMDVTYGPELRFIPPASARSDFAQLLPSSGLLARISGLLLPYVPRAVIAAYIKRLLVTWQHPEKSLFEHGAILINRQGERFCDELVWPDRELAVARQPTKEVFLLLDCQLADRFNKWPHFVSTAPEIAYAYVNDYLRLRPDVAISGRSLEAIANDRGLPADALAKTVDAVNEQRSDPKCKLPSLQQGPWTLLGPLRAYFTTTEGGAAITERFEVVDDKSQPIPGLYAIGQNGLGGQILWGHGLHIAWAMTSGRLVAEVLAKNDRHVARSTGGATKAVADDVIREFSDSVNSSRSTDDK